MILQDTLEQEYNYQEKDDTAIKKERLFPSHLIVEPTNICNLSCIMCPSSLQKRKRGVISVALWKKIIDEVALNSPDAIVWTAVLGEALVAGEAFLDMLEYGSYKNVRLMLNTNGILLTEAWINKLLFMNLEGIIVGVDALLPSTYKKIRRGGDLIKVKNNILKLLEHNNDKKIIVQFICQEENEQEKDSFIEFWLSKGAIVKVRPPLRWGEAGATPHLALPPEERNGECPFMSRACTIHWDGVVVQCDADWDQKEPLGNVNKNSIAEIWNGPLSERRKRHHDCNIDFFPCNVCKDWQAGFSQFHYP
jgi:MoaA/NifB/PqqE/SkfB family radical SAM enzyme